MADQDLRALARRYRETDAPADGSAYLRAALRAGVVRPERVELAGVLGVPGASEVAGVSALTSEDLEAWGQGFARRAWLVDPGDAEPAVRLGLAAARAALERGEGALGRRALGAAEALLAEPSPPRAAEALAAARSAFPNRGEVGDLQAQLIMLQRDRGAPPSEVFAQAIARMGAEGQAILDLVAAAGEGRDDAADAERIEELRARLVEVGPRSEAQRAAASAALAALSAHSAWADERDEALAAQALAWAAEVLGHDGVVAAVRREVGAWLLRTGAEEAR
jgi:hypothetical protein